MVLPRVQVRELRRTYGFEEVAIVPGDVTTNPELSTTDLQIGPFRFSIPIIASAERLPSDTIAFTLSSPSGG